MIHLGDCVTVMAGMPADSVDAVVTDPPAGIAFMSKHWDRDKGGRTEWVAWMTEVMRECYRVLKPGGYAVVWSLPRTCHWTAWAMEDAGFIIRDQLAHIFASGFPKGKAQLKPAREDWWLARKPGPLRPLNIEETRIGTPDGHGGGRYGSSGFVSGYRRSDSGDRRTHQATGNGEEGQGSDGLGSEIVEHGSLGRPADGERTDGSPASGFVASGVGRWPSNLLLSDPELFDEPNPYVVGSGATATSGVGEVGTGSGRDDFYNGGIIKSSYGDSGGYSRFFIVPKADRRDREPTFGGIPSPRAVPDDRNSRINTHPTCKPTDLMRHLIRLVTPPGGVVLDPFLGSGSTAIACELEGFPWIGIEQDATYVAIAEARLNGVQRGLGLDVGAPISRPPKTHPDLSKHQPKQRAPSENYTGGWAGTDEEPAA